MGERLPVVIDVHESPDEADAIDLNDPRWGGGLEAELPEMDEDWCRRRLWQITTLLREQVDSGRANAVVVMALKEEAGIVKALMAKVLPNAKPREVGKKRVEELPDDELDAEMERLRREGKL